MRIGDFDLTVAPASDGSLGIVMKNAQRGFVTWLDPERFELCPRYVCMEEATRIVESCRPGVSVEDLARALQAKCRRVLEKVAL